MFSCVLFDFLFFKQKTAYEMRISDWSSDVCSSDLPLRHRAARPRRDADGEPDMSGGKAKLVQTPSQTVGPFFAYGLTPEQYGYPTLASIASPNVLGGDLRTPDVDGERIRLVGRVLRSEEHPSELQSLMRLSYAVFCLTKKNNH